MKKTKKLLVAMALAAMAPACVGLAACGSKDPTPGPGPGPGPTPSGHTHSFVHHDAVPADCQTAGTGEYWSCSGCEDLFGDANGANKIDAPATTEKTAHSVKAYGHDDTTHWQECEYCHGADTKTTATAHENEFYISQQPTKTNYIEGDVFDKAGMVAVIGCECGFENDVTNDIVIENAETPLEAGGSVTVIYNGQQDVPLITVSELRMTAVDITMKEGVKYYNNGKALPTAADFEVVATYNNGTTATLGADEYTVSAVDGFAQNGGKITVQVTNNFSKEFDVELVEVAMDSLEVKTNPANTVFRTDDEFDLNGLVLSVVYNDGSTKDITEGFTCEELGKTHAANFDAVVSYTEGGVTKSVTIAITVSDEDGAVVSIKFADDAEYKAYVGEAFPEATLTVYAVYESGRSLPLEDGEYTIAVPTGTVQLGAAYTVTATAGEGENAKTVSLPVTVVAKIEGESASKIAGGKIKTEAEYSEDMVKGEDVTFVGDFSRAAIAGEDAYAEWTVQSQTVCDATVTFRAGNSNIYQTRAANKDDGITAEYRMNPLQVNTVADLYVNGVKVEIPNDIILKGCGPCEGGYAPIYGIYNEFTISGIKLGAGENIIRFAFKPSTTGEKNSWNESPSTMNLERLEIVTQGNANPVQATIESIAVYDHAPAYGDIIQTALDNMPVVATMSDGSKVVLDKALYDVTITAGNTDNAWFGFDTYTFTATLKADNTVTANRTYTIDVYFQTTVKTASIEIIDGKVYYIFGFDNIGYTDEDYEFFNNNTIYPIDKSKTETTYNTIKLYIDVTDLAAGTTVYPHARVKGVNYVNGANSNGDVRGSSLKFTNNQSVTLNGKTYTLKEEWSMPTLVVANA